MDNKNALAILAKNAETGLVFARKEEIENVSPQYEPIVTVLEIAPEEFTDMGMGNMYPGKSATNRISDAAGVSFLHNVGGTREVGSWSSVKVAKQPGGYFQATGEYKVIGVAQGQRLKPDGTPRLSSVREYEFSVVDRANEDFLNDQNRQNGPKYTTEVAALKHLLELKKFSTQRASTGAELAVVRELVGLPTAFKKNQIGKPMVFSQIIENNRFKVDIAREIMKTPDGRQAVVSALFGTTQALYGPQPAQSLPPTDPAPQDIPAAEGQQMTSAVPDDEIPFGPEPEDIQENPREAALNSLRDWLESDALSPKQKAIIGKACEDPNTPLEGDGGLMYYLDLCNKQADIRAKGRAS